MRTGLTWRDLPLSSESGVQLIDDLVFGYLDVDSDGLSICFDL